MEYEYDIAVLMETYRQPAIMVRRPYPPLNLPTRNSHLGGRPSLPSGLDWPRMRKGRPLHFLAQIDCSELPSTDGMLPESGILFFFARIDEELLWGDDNEPAHDHCRVLYAPKIGAGPVEPPRDLPAIMDGYSALTQDFGLPDDPPVQLYPEWQVEFHSIDSWPDASAIAYDVLAPEIQPTEKEKARAYQKAVSAARDAQALRLLGEPVRDSTQTLPSPRESGLMLPSVSEEQPFPQVWILIDRITRSIVARCLQLEKWWRPGSHGPNPEQLQETRAACAEWIDAVRGRALDEAPDHETSLRFVAGLDDLARKDFWRRDIVNTAISNGIRSAIQYAASAPKAALLIPPAYFQKLGEQRTLHQMLGNTRAAQVARPVERDEVLLLQLQSDYGVTFMFCDVGEASFWINKADLAARDFSRVFATTEGG